MANLQFVGKFIKENDLFKLQTIAETIAGNSTLIKLTIEELDKLDLKYKKDFLMNILCKYPYDCYQFFTINNDLLEHEYRSNVLNTIAREPHRSATILAFYEKLVTEEEYDLLFDSTCSSYNDLNNYMNTINNYAPKVKLMNKALNENNLKCAKYIYNNMKRFKLTTENKDKINQLMLLEKLLGDTNTK